jgi:hypothetical protein
LPEFVIDGRYESFWVTNKIKSEEEFTVTFDKPFTVNEIRITW